MTRPNSRRSPATMLGVRLHGPKNLRVERISRPGAPGGGQALVRVRHTGSCGGDPHCSADARNIHDEAAALLEPRGVAIHAVDFAKLRVGRSVAIIGAGPIGLLILQVAKLAGADPIFITDKFPWRLKLAQKWGGIPIRYD